MAFSMHLPLLVLCIILPTLTVQIKTLLEKNYMDQKEHDVCQIFIVGPHSCNSSTEIDAFLSHVLFIFIGSIWNIRVLTKSMNGLFLQSPCWSATSLNQHYQIICCYCFMACHLKIRFEIERFVRQAYFLGIFKKLKARKTQPLRKQGHFCQKKFMSRDQ